MENENLYGDEEIVGYCTYCKNPILKDKPVTIDEGNQYHPECHKLLKNPYGYNDDEDTSPDGELDFS